MRRSPFYRDDFVGATQKVIDTRTAQKNQADGIVVVIDTIGSVQVQLRGASNFTPVDVSEGIKIAVGDRVLLRRGTDTSRWIIYQNFGSGGRTTATGSTSSSSGVSVAAPTNFLARGEADGILFTWTPLAPDGGFVYEIDVADDTSDTGTVVYQVAGAAWYLHTTGTHSCRMRSVGADWTRSGWTDWVTVTALIAGSVAGPGTSTLRSIATYDDADGQGLLDNPNANIDSSGNIRGNTFRLPAATILTISSGVVTITQGYHFIESGSGTTDNLTTINGGVAEQILTIQADSGDTITVKHGTGNVFLNGGADFVLSGHKTLALFYDGANWSDIGANGSVSASDATPSATGVVLIEQSPLSGHPRAITIIERNTPNGLSPVDTNNMRSTMELPLVGGQSTGAVAEMSRWVRSASNPLFGGANASAAHEPTVIAENGILKMWYGAGWGTGVINYATSVDGLTWTQYGSNPVYSAISVSGPFVVKFDGIYYMYMADNGGTGALYLSTSTDGITWSAATVIFAANAYVWEIAWGNPYVWREGYTWYGLFEYRQPSGGNFQMSLFSSPDGISWTLIQQPVLSLRPGTGGDVGNAFMPYGVQKRNGLYHVWYHGNTNTTTLPTEIYHATSPDLTTWTITNSGNPILTHNAGTYEKDQIGDPSIIEFNNQTFLYYDGIDNGTNSSWISVLTYTGRLSELLDGAAVTRVDIKEGSAPSPNPLSGLQALFIDSTSHHLNRVNSSGAVVDIEGSAFDVDTILTDADGSILVDENGDVITS